MSEARWTPSPTGERELARDMRRVARHDWVALTLGAAVIVLAVGGSCWSAIAFLPSLVEQIVGSVLAAIVGAIAAWRIDQRRERLVQEAQAADLTLREGFGTGRGWLVEMRILQGAAPSGEDRGMMWIEGDRLYFSGHRTSFGLTKDQIAGPCLKVAPIEGLRYEGLLPLTFRTSAGAMALSLRLREKTSGEMGTLSSEIERLAETAPVGQGQSPPTERGFGIPSRPQVLVGAIASTLFWAFVICLTLLGYFVPAFAIAAFGMWTFHAHHPGTRWRAWRDLGRLPK